MNYGNETDYCDFRLGTFNNAFLGGQQMGIVKKGIETRCRTTTDQHTGDTIIISEKHHPNLIVRDLDGDNVSDTVEIVVNGQNEKYGLELIFGNNKVEYLGLGKDVVGQGFEDLAWIGIFKKAPKGEVYFNNVNKDGEIIGENEIEESDKIKLPNDGIYMHQAEASGGGVVYLNNGKLEWIQQD